MLWIFWWAIIFTFTTRWTENRPLLYQHGSRRFQLYQSIRIFHGHSLFVTCHLCQFLIFPSFPDVTLFIAKGPNVIPSSLIIVMLGLSETNKKRPLLQTENGDRGRRKMFIYFEPFLSKQCYFEWQFLHRWAIYCCNI